MPKPVVVIPAFNEEGSIRQVLMELSSVLPDIDVCVVDDGSSDATAAIAKATGAKVVRLPVNIGIGGAIQTGYLWAVRNGYDPILRIDADGQHDPASAPSLFAALEGGADVAIGSRFLTSEENHRPPPLRRIGIRIFSAIVSLLAKQRISDPTSGYRCLTAEAAAFGAHSHPFDFPEVEGVVNFARGGFKVTEVPVIIRERTSGRSTIRGRRAAYYALKVLIALFIIATRPRTTQR